MSLSFLSRGIFMCGHELWPSSHRGRKLKRESVLDANRSHRFRIKIIKFNRSVNSLKVKQNKDFIDKNGKRYLGK